MSEGAYTAVETKMTTSPAELTAEYKKKKREIKKRLRAFNNLHKSKFKGLFPELCFCLLTPQSNARYCDRAIRELKRSGKLFKGGRRAIRSALKGRSRFHNKKALYILNARACFDPGILKSENIPAIRDILVKKIKGLGYKEASHFLRNIGLGKGLAILDRHIIKNLKRYGVIQKVPPSLTRRAYLNIEERSRAFAQKIKIPLEELDLLLWSKETGEIFK